MLNNLFSPFCCTFLKKRSMRFFFALASVGFLIFPIAYVQAQTFTLLESNVEYFGYSGQVLSDTVTIKLSDTAGMENSKSYSIVVTDENYRGQKNGLPK